MIKCISIDCWGTILEDNHDWDCQLRTIAAKFLSTGPNTVDQARIERAFCKESAEFKARLHEQFVTTRLSDRLNNLARYAQVQVSQEARDAMLNAFESTIFKPLPNVITGANTFLEKLKLNDLKVCIICNTGWFSSRAITAALVERNLGKYFDGLIYSDEVGCAKPSQEIFNRALNILNCRREKTVHIGDQVETDVRGAQNAGLRVIHFHSGPRCSIENVWCASDYDQVWDILLGDLHDEASALNS